MNTAGIEWFGPPERNTLRPLCVVLLVFPSTVCCIACVPLVSRESGECLGELKCICVLAGVLSLLYVQGEHVHSAGSRQVDPAIYY